MADVATFDVPLELGHATARERTSVSTSGVRGPFLRRQSSTAHAEASGRREIRRWSLAWETADKGIAYQVERLYTLSRAGAHTLAFTPPDEVDACSVRFMPGGLAIKQLTPALYLVECELEEVA